MSEQAKQILLYISCGVLFIGLVFLIVGFCLKGGENYSFFQVGMAVLKNQNLAGFHFESLL
ncbi:MAG: hypothetical protein LKJ88_00090 [Bacilli bacterium]|jgi:hypothetical protein|nr:hypothetical protein [Bacilli bacterium]